jgi:hypothetical protein
MKKIITAIASTVLVASFIISSNAMAHGGVHHREMKEMRHEIRHDRQELRHDKRALHRMKRHHQRHMNDMKQDYTR